MAKTIRERQHEGCRQVARQADLVEFEQVFTFHLAGLPRTSGAHIEVPVYSATRTVLAERVQLKIGNRADVGADGPRATVGVWVYGEIGASDGEFRSLRDRQPRWHAVSDGVAGDLLDLARLYGLI